MLTTKNIYPLLFLSFLGYFFLLAPNQALEATENAPVVVPFHPDSIWNQPISATPVVDPNSAQMIKLLIAESHNRINIDGINGAWSVPVYRADAMTPLQPVCDADGQERCEMIRIPPEMIPSPDGDAKSVIIDGSLNPPRAWSFWALRRRGANGGWTVDRGAFGWTDVSSSGDGLLNYQGGEWGGRVTGWNYIGGLIQPAEIIQGRIDHALVFLIPRRAAATGLYVWPAQGTDGVSSDPFALRLGSRIQLDPSIDVNTLPLNAGAKVIARALQVYGGWIGDTGEAAAVDAREYIALNRSGQPYIDAKPWQGLLTYHDLYRFPMESLRVLQTDPADFHVN
jgi:hypothetical protein